MRVRCQLGESSGLYVIRQKALKCLKPARREWKLIQVVREVFNRITVILGGSEKPPFTVLLVMEFMRVVQIAKRNLHPLSEFCNCIHYFVVLQVTHHFLAVDDIVAILEGRIEERCKIEFIPIGSDRAHDLVEIQIAKELRWLFHFLLLFLPAVWKQNAAKPDGIGTGLVRRSPVMVSGTLAYEVDLEVTTHRNLLSCVVTAPSR